MVMFVSFKGSDACITVTLMPFPRTILAIIFIMAKNGTWVVEQPSTSLWWRHPRFRELLRITPVPWLSPCTIAFSICCTCYPRSGFPGQLRCGDRVSGWRIMAPPRRKELQCGVILRAFAIYALRLSPDASKTSMPLPSRPDI